MRRLRCVIILLIMVTFNGHAQMLRRLVGSLIKTDSIDALASCYYR